MKNQDMGALNMLDDLVKASKGTVNKILKVSKKALLLTLTALILAGGASMFATPTQLFNPTASNTAQQEQAYTQADEPFIGTFAENVKDGYSISDSHYLVALENLQNMNTDGVSVELIMSMLNGEVSAEQLAEIGISPSILTSIQTAFEQNVDKRNPSQYIRLVAQNLKSQTGIDMNFKDLGDVIHYNHNMSPSLSRGVDIYHSVNHLETKSSQNHTQVEINQASAQVAQTVKKI